MISVFESVNQGSRVKKLRGIVYVYWFIWKKYLRILFIWSSKHSKMQRASEDEENPSQLNLSQFVELAEDVISC